LQKRLKEAIDFEGEIIAGLYCRLLKETAKKDENLSLTLSLERRGNVTTKLSA